ncbi:hypothetical protein [Longispora urticae]
MELCSFDEADERFDLSGLPVGFDPGDWRRVGTVEVHSGATRLASLLEDEVSAEFVVVDGDLRVDGPIVFGRSESVLGLLVLGAVTAETFTLGHADVYITGDLTVSRHVHTPRSASEQGMLQVEGLLRTPVILREDETNPGVYDNLTVRLDRGRALDPRPPDRARHLGPADFQDALADPELLARYFAPGSMGPVVVDVAGLIRHCLNWGG